MPTINIADKPTLDTVKTDTASILSRGGLKSNGTDIQAYNPTTSSWDTVSLGGGGSSSITIINKDSLYTDKVFTIESEDGSFSEDVTMTGSSVSQEVPCVGMYIISWTNDNNETRSQYFDVTGFGNYIVIPYYVANTNFGSCTDEELGIMLNAYYDGIINLADYWSIGDNRVVSLLQTDSVNTLENILAQDVTFAIADFNHDDLTSSINNKTKSAVTLTQVDCLKTAGKMGNQSSWYNSPRRTWCNQVYYNALPSIFKSYVKQVNKISASSYNGTTNQTSSDYCFLPTEKEIVGDMSNFGNYTEQNAQTQYSYYSATGNIFKTKLGVESPYWTRSFYRSSSTSFVYVLKSPGNSYYTSYQSYSTSYGIAPFICL